MHVIEFRHKFGKIHDRLLLLRYASKTSFDVSVNDGEDLHRVYVCAGSRQRPIPLFESRDYLELFIAHIFRYLMWIILVFGIMITGVGGVLEFVRRKKEQNVKIMSLQSLAQVNEDDLKESPRAISTVS